LAVRGLAISCQETTAVSLLDRLVHHSIVVVTDASRSVCEKPETNEARRELQMKPLSTRRVTMT